MGATTPNLALPYPVPADTIDIPRDVKALADKLDTYRAISGPALVTSLPGSPVDGQEIYYQSSAMATDGVVWHLRYRTTSSSTYKWEFIGGAPLRAVAEADTSVSSTSAWTDPGTPGPDIVVPLMGDYDAEAQSNGYSNGVACTIALGITSPGGTPASPSETYVPAALVREQQMAHERLTNLAAGATLRLRYWGNGGGGQFATFGKRKLRIWPVRVG